MYLFRIIKRVFKGLEQTVLNSGLKWRIERFWDWSSVSGRVGIFCMWLFWPVSGRGAGAEVLLFIFSEWKRRKKMENFGSDDFGFWSSAWLWVGGVMCGGFSRLGMGD